MNGPGQHRADTAADSEAVRRNLSELHLLSALLFVMGTGLLIALPFALRAGAEFFLPLVIALVISLALAPMADALGARGAPNSLASLLALASLALIVLLAGTLVIQPALAMLDRFPDLSDRLADRIEVLAGAFGRIAGAIDELTRATGLASANEVVVSSGGVLENLLLQTPGVLLQAVLTLLLAYFMLEARLRMRRTLLLDRQEFSGSLRAANVLRDVQTQMGAYFLTTFLVACSVGMVVGVGAWAFGWEQPVMWGGLAAMLNLLPYIGPLTMGVVLALFGLGTDASLVWALAPAAAYGILHAVEANAVTPVVIGRKLELSPVAILSSLIFFGWIWGIAGAFLSGPLLLIISAMLDHIGRPNVIGFLFGEPLFAAPLFAAPPGDAPDGAGNGREE